MMKVFYRLVWHISLLTAWLIFPVLLIMRKDLATWFLARLLPNPMPTSIRWWFHAVSVGELKMLQDLIRLIPSQQLGSICVTTTTPNGWQNLSHWALPIHKAHLPFDIPFSLQRFMRNTEPNLVLVEGEIWFELIHQVRKNGGKVLVINGRFKNVQGILFQNSLKSIDHFWVRGPSDAQNLKKVSVNDADISVAGNLKFDLKNPKDLDPQLKSWCEAGPLICIGSVAEDEIEWAQAWVDEIRKLTPKHRILYAPRQIQNANKHLPKILEQDRCYRSRGQANSSDLLILDSIGELAATYAYADFAIIGGGFGKRGGQNFIEALAVGCPVICGPHMKNFSREADDAKNAGVLWMLHQPRQLKHILEQIQARSNLADQCVSFVLDHQGALARTYKGLVDFGLESPTIS